MWRFIHHLGIFITGVGIGGLVSEYLMIKLIKDEITKRTQSN